MEYKEIIAISGMSGLYQLLSSKADGGIVRSLEDKTTRFVSSRIHHFTPLESIEVFTTGESVTLADIFKAMQQKEEIVNIPVSKTDDVQILREYFSSVYPQLDKDKVYVSDMKKMVKWYTILKANDLLQFEAETQNNEDVTNEKNEGLKVAEKNEEVMTKNQKPAVKTKSKKEGITDEKPVVNKNKKEKDGKKKTEK